MFPAAVSHNTNQSVYFGTYEKSMNTRRLVNIDTHVLFKQYKYSTAAVTITFNFKVIRWSAIDKTAVSNYSVNCLYAIHGRRS